MYCHLERDAIKIHEKVLITKIWYSANIQILIATNSV